MAAPRRIRSERELRDLSPREQEARLRAAEALHEKRTHPKLGLSAAARRRGTTPATVKRYFGHLFSRNPGGPYVPARSDREPFLMDVVDPRGQLVEKVVRGSAVRQRNLAHHRALARFAGPDGGETASLKPFVGKRVAGVELLTDPDMIERLFDAGELDFLEYQSF